MEDDELTSLHNFFAAVAIERSSQDDSWGGPDHDDQLTPFEWLTILAIQAGHTAQRALLHAEFNDTTYHTTERALRQELVQVAAVAAAWDAKLDREP